MLNSQTKVFQVIKFTYQPVRYQLINKGCRSRKKSPRLLLRGAERPGNLVFPDCYELRDRFARNDVWDDFCEYLNIQVGLYHVASNGRILLEKGVVNS